MKKKAKGLFDGGEMYATCARILHSNGMFVPSIVNGALAMEMYFKSIYILDFGKEFKHKNQHSHDFLILFDQLTLETQKQLIDEFEKAVAQLDKVELKAHKRMMKQEAGADVSLALRANLTQWHDAFVILRYVHEFTEDAKSQKRLKRYWMFLDQVEEAVRRTAFDKETGWMM